jgi:N-methylhydantoinase B
MPAVGALGGEAARTNQTLVRRDGKEETLPGKFSRLPVHPGETITFLTAGGGGFGDPSERAAASVKRDIALGYVSEEQAKEKYPLARTKDP